MHFLLTGRPGIGKTTALSKIVEKLRAEGYKVGGMITFEVRSGGRRIGFKVRDITTGEEGWLARKGSGSGPRVGRYVVDLNDLERIGVSAIRKAVQEADVIAIDEIGPMELYSEEFKNAVTEAFNSGKPVVATIHIRADRYPFTRNLKRKAKLFYLTLENRDKIPEIVYNEVKKFLS